jgi:hypothetical protein
MPLQVLPISIEASADDAEWYNGTFNSTRTYNWIGKHVTASLGPWTGYRFPKPNIDPDSIVSVKIKASAGNTGLWDANIRVEPGHAPVWASSGANRPDTRYNAVTSTGQVRWQQTTTPTVNTTYESPDITALVKPALENLATGEYLGIIFGPHDSAATQMQQMLSRDFTTNTTLRPYLEITYEVPVKDETVNVGTVNVAASIPQDWTHTAKYFDAVQYTNGTALAAKDQSLNGSRRLNVWVPTGTAPVNGWPLAVWVHGGFFTGGSRSTIPRELVARLVRRGYAVAAVGYRLAQVIADGLQSTATGNEVSFPVGIHDVKIALRMFRLDREGPQLYNVNVNNLLLTGHSAGTSIVQMVGYTKNDSNEYIGMTPTPWPGNTRPAHVGRTTASTYTFDFHQNGESGINSFEVKGMFLFAGVTSLQRGTNSTFTPNADARQAISNGRRAYLSRTILGGMDTTVYGEIDVDKYLIGGGSSPGTPTLNEPYLAKAPTVPDFPIAFAHGTADILTTKAAAYDPFRDALLANGYISTEPTTNEINPDGLTYIEISGADHDQMEFSPLAVAKFFEWLDVIEPDTSTDALYEASIIDSVVSVPTAGVSASGSWTVPVGTISATATVPSVDVTATRSSILDAEFITVTSTVPAPTITAVRNVTVSLETVSVGSTVPSPSVSTGSSVNAVSVASVVDIPIPSITTTAEVAVPSVSASASVPTPGVIAGGSRTVPVGTVSSTAAVPAPAVTATKNVVVSVSTIEAIASTPAPTVTGTEGTITSIVVPAGIVSVAVTLPTPTVRVRAPLPPPTGSSVMTPLEFAQDVLNTAANELVDAPQTQYAQLGTQVVDCESLIVAATNVSESPNDTNCSSGQVTFVVTLARDCANVANRDGTTDVDALSTVNAVLERDGAALRAIADLYLEATDRSVAWTYEGGIAVTSMQMTVPIPCDEYMGMF